MAAEKKNTVNKVEEHPVATHEELPEYLKGKDGMGSENVGMKHVTIPRLSVLQKLSPQLDESKPNYIHGAKEGDIINTLTSDNYGKEILFVSAFFREEWMVAVDQKQGGGGGKGFRGIYLTEEEAQDHIRLKNDKNENLIVTELGVHYGIVLDEARNAVTMIALPMKSSQLKESRRMNGLIKQKGGPQWAAAWKLETHTETNAAGQSYKNYKVTPTAGFTPKAVAEACEVLWKQISGGLAKMDETGLGSDPDAAPDRTDI